MNLKKSKFNIVFFGTPSFVDPVLVKLQENFDVVAVIRNKEQYDSIFNNKSSIINDVDFFVVASFGQILPNKILEIPKIAAVNIHPSLLPTFRGPSPIQNAILNGDKITGVTIIKMDDKMDHGPIIEQTEVEIKENETFESFAEKSFKLASEMLPSLLINHDKWKLTTQDESKATYTKLLTKQSGFIDLSIANNEISIISRMIRAYFPWPGVWTKFNLSGKEVVVKFLPDEKIQVEGKNPMSYKDFINGYANGKDLLEKLNLLK